MTALVELETAGGKQQVRIFSLRGCHLIGMLARTAIAKQFRAWVLDVLEKYTRPIRRLTSQATKKALPGGLTCEQQDAIKALVRSRVDALPENQRAKAAICCWSSLKSKFGCTYKAIPPEYFGEALSLVARLPLEGELLPPPRKPVKTYHYPRKLLEQPHFTTPKIPASLGVSMLANTKEFVSPLFALLNELRTDGHDISSPWDEAIAMREAIQRADKAMEEITSLMWVSRFDYASTAGNT